LKTNKDATLEICLVPEVLRWLFARLQTACHKAPIASRDFEAGSHHSFRAQAVLTDQQQKHTQITSRHLLDTFWTPTRHLALISLTASDLATYWTPFGHLVVFLNKKRLFAF